MWGYGHGSSSSPGTISSRAIPSPAWENVLRSPGTRRRTRVLLLIKGLGAGGAERLLVDVVANRDRERFDYEVAYVIGSLDALVPDLAATGVRVHRLGARASWDLRWPSRLRRLLVRGSYDIVHSHLPYSAGFGRLVVRTLPRTRRPALVYTEHSLWNKAAILTKALNSATVGMDDALIVVSPAARDALPARLSYRATVVVHGVDRARAEKILGDREDMRQVVRSELGVPEGHLLALTVANLREEKGYDVLIAAACFAVHQGAPIEFVSVGAGPDAESLSRERDEAGLGHHMRFLGFRADTLRLMAGADIFVLPSHQEGMPVALMEAMSMGLPVVATRVGGVPDVVTDGVEGLLVPTGRAELLWEAISKLAGDEGLRSRMSRAARQRSSEFDIAVATSAIEAMYDHLPRRR